MRSLAENMDRAFQPDDQWFADYTTAYKNAVTNGATVADAHKLARTTSDQGRFIPGTDAFNNKKDERTESRLCITIEDPLRFRTGALRPPVVYNGIKESLPLTSRGDLRLHPPHSSHANDVIDSGFGWLTNAIENLRRR